MVASELRQLHSKLADVAKSASFVNQAKKNLVPDPRSGPSVEMLESPELLATIVTVLINKYGNTRLGLDDFAIGDDKFVSVYVDTATDEILLSLDGGLADDSYEDALIGFANGTPDDNTYH